MLSSVTQGGAGQPLVAHAEMRSTVVAAGNPRGGGTKWSAAGTSHLNVSEHLAEQVLPATRWVQIDRIIYTGEDKAQPYVFATRRTSKREINVEGAAH